MKMDSGEPVGCESERLFYRRLLELGRQQEQEPLLDNALALIVEATGAKLAYVELFDEEPGGPRYWKASGCGNDDIAAIRESLSRGIIAATLAAGRTVETPSARNDERFAKLASVRHNAIEAVLCAPIGRPVVGALYLQDRAAGGPFSPRDREWAELFAAQLALVAERLASRARRPELEDHTAEVRRRFRCPLVGRSAAMAKVLTEAADMAPLDIGILITGPTGSGKSFLARSIHDNSRRAAKPFLALNCGAIPSTLIESELFGAEKGSYTGAHARAIGKVGAARGGTLFLDEIGDLANDAQVKLLQLLQDKMYYPVGSSQPVAADVRIIAATHRDLKERMAQGQFRSDLFYRLNGIVIEMPALSARRDDIPLLAEQFCADACRKHGLREMPVSRRVLAMVREMRWDGEIRELASAIEAAVVRADAAGATTLVEHHFSTGRPTNGRSDQALTYREAMRRSQRRILLDALEELDWNVTKAADQLDIARAHLYSLIGELELKRPTSGR
jgi:Nif-specific regulatory protein